MILNIKKWLKSYLNIDDIDGDGIIDCVSIDSKSIETSNTLFIALKGSYHDGHNFINENMKYIIVSKESGITGSNIIPVKDQIKALNSLAKYYRQTLKTEIIAITGSTGKTTQKEALKQILEKKYKVFSSPDSFNSKLGIPLSILSIPYDCEVAIIEVGISDKGDMSNAIDIIKPFNAIITNISDNHIRNMKSFKNLINEKFSILNGLNNNWGIAPYNYNIDEKQNIFLNNEKYKQFPAIAVEQKKDKLILKINNRNIYFNNKYFYSLLGINNIVRSAILMNIDIETIIKTIKDFKIYSTYNELWINKYGKSILKINLSQKEISIDKHKKTANYLINKSSQDLITSDSENIHEIAISNNEFISDTVSMINLTYIKDNINYLHNYSPDKKIMIIIKANSYGIDMVTLARYLQYEKMTDILGVAYLNEAIKLRKNGITLPIFIISSSFEGIPLIVHNSFEIAVNNINYVKELQKEAKKQDKIINVHLNIDTGMGRLGCNINDALEIALEIQKSNNLKLNGIMTHFATAENKEKDYFLLEQYKKFSYVVSLIKKAEIEFNFLHGENSAALLRFNFKIFNMARVGLAIYGINKFGHKLKQTISVRSKILSIFNREKGSNIGYNLNYIVEKEISKVALIPIGHFDGLKRIYENGFFFINGEKAKIIGSICMDYTMVDVTNIKDVKVGNDVILFDDDKINSIQSIESFVKFNNSSLHEFLSGLSTRIDRIFIYE